MKKYKILYIQKPPGGGSVVALYEMVRMLDKTRFEPIILCYEANKYTRVFEQLDAKVLYLNQSSNTPNVGSPATQKTPVKILAPLRKLKRLFVDDRIKSKQIAAVISDSQVDLIHHNNDINDSRQAVLANTKTRLPQVCHYRSLKPYTNDLVNFGIDYFMSKKIDFHIYISKAVQDHFRNTLRIKKNKGVVVRDIIDVKKYSIQPANVKLMNEFGFQPDDMVFTNIGRISRWKGQHIFVEALAAVIKKHPTVRALIVGPYDPGVGDFKYYKELQKMIAGYDLDDKVILTGNRDDIPAILSITDFVVHSAIEPEPQGLVIVEALFYGKPVIVSDAGGAAELIVNNEGGIKVRPGNVADLANAMEALIMQRSAYDPFLNPDDRPAILSEFIPEEQIRVIEGIYELLLN